MSVEKRVAALEEEIKVLKGEIQQVLLEIKEYLLEARYPELTGATPKAPVVATSMAGPVPEEDAHESGRPANGHALLSLTHDLDGTTRGAPSNGNGNPTQPDLAALASWVDRTVRRVGRERTRQILSLWSQGNRELETWARLLLELVNLASEPEEPAEAGFQAVATALMELEQLTRRSPNGAQDGRTT